MSETRPSSWPSRAAAVPALVVLGLAACDSGPTDPAPPPQEVVVPRIEGIAFGGGAFVGVGGTFVKRGDGSVVQESDSVLVVRSTEGAAWTPAGPPLPGRLSDVAYGAGRWVAVGGAVRTDDPADPPRVVTSDDGVTWERVDVQGGLRWQSVAYGNGGFVATAFDPDEVAEVILVSADGLTWAETARADLWSPRVSFGGGRFVLWGESGGVGVSADGVDWQVRGVPFVNHITALVHAEGRWIGAGVYDCCFGEEPELVDYYDLGSTDGGTWQSEERDVREWIFDIDVLDGVFVAAAGRRLLVSDSEGVWRSATELDDETVVLELACSDAVCVAAGAALATSGDLEAWEVREIPH